MMSIDTAAMLEARDVHVTFGGISALSGVNLTIAPGQVFGLIGPNGAGKTTMVNVLSGFQHRCCVDGHHRFPGHRAQAPTRNSNFKSGVN